MSENIDTSSDDLDATVDDDELIVELSEPAIDVEVASETGLDVSLQNDELEAFVSDQITVAGVVETKQAVGKPVTDDKSGVVQGTSQTVLSYTASGDTDLLGFDASGTTDGRYTIQKNGSHVTEKYASRSEPNVQQTFPTSIELEDGDKVSVLVENTDIETGDYTATIYVNER